MSAALRASLEAALKAAAKPITAEQVLSLAAETLPALQAEQFRTWFEKNGATLLENLNG